MAKSNVAQRLSNPQQERFSVGVVGARGYTGLELCRLLLDHPNADLMHIYATQKFELGDYLASPKAQKIKGETQENLRETLKDMDTVFLATPAETSAELAPHIIEHGVNVIDLSGAYRLQKGSLQNQIDQYKSWYGFNHASPKLISDAFFGIQPFLKPSGVIKSQLISNPGCYATASMLGLAPLLRDQLISPKKIVIDAKSGTTGAGKKAEERLIHSEVADGCTPYKWASHQHQPEIEQTLSSLSNLDVEVQFTAHLMPFRRGILTSIYADLLGTSDEVEASFKRHFQNQPLIEVLKLPDNAKKLNLRRVVGTAKSLIGWATEVRGDSQRISIFVMIDNLMKGAASQAIENFNTSHGLAAETGLINLEGSI